MKQANDNLPELLTVDEAINECMRVKGRTREDAIEELCHAIKNDDLGLYEKVKLP